MIILHTKKIPIDRLKSSEFLKESKPAKQEHRGRIRVRWRRDLIDLRPGPTAAAAEGAISYRGARRRVGASGGRGGSGAQGGAGAGLRRVEEVDAVLVGIVPLMMAQLDL